MRNQKLIQLSYFLVIHFTVTHLLLCQESFSGYKVIGTRPHPFENIHKIQQLDPEKHLQIQTEAERQMDKLPRYRLLNPEEEEKVQETYKKLTAITESFECVASQSLFILKEALKYYGNFGFYKDGNPIFPAEDPRRNYSQSITFYAYQILLSSNTNKDRLLFLKRLLPEFLLTEEEIQKTLEMKEKIFYTQGKEEEKYSYYYNYSFDYLRMKRLAYFNSYKFYAELKIAIEKIKKITQPGDTIVGVGNTPQFILNALKYVGHPLNLISVAISGCPGGNKNWLTDILTEKGLKNYQNYLEQVGLSPLKKHGRLFFMDIIGQGCGIEFLVHEIIQKYQASGIVEPDINIIALNEIGKKFYGKSLEIDAYSLNLPILSKRLDEIGEEGAENRTLISFPAYKWDEWKSDPMRIPATHGAQIIIQNIHDYFSKIESGNCIYRFMK